MSPRLLLLVFILLAACLIAIGLPFLAAGSLKREQTLNFIPRTRTATTVPSPTFESPVVNQTATSSLTPRPTRTASLTLTPTPTASSTSTASVTAIYVQPSHTPQPNQPGSPPGSGSSNRTSLPATAVPPTSSPPTRPPPTSLPPTDPPPPLPPIILTLLPFP